MSSRSVLIGIIATSLLLTPLTSCSRIFRSALRQQRQEARQERIRQEQEAMLRQRREAEVQSRTTPVRAARNQALQEDRKLYGRLQRRMSLRDVEQILGGGTFLQAVERRGQRVGAVYKWELKTGDVQATFVEDQLRSKRWRQRNP